MYISKGQDWLACFNLEGIGSILIISLAGTGGVVLVSAVVVRRFWWGRALEQELAKLIKNQKGWELPLLAIMSGFGEEVFFRGGMQPTLGITLTSIIFGLIHFPIKRELIAWPIFALLMGFFLGWQFEYTGSLVTPIITHTLINTIHLYRIHARVLEP
jgi:hypothetical protein